MNYRIFFALLFFISSTTFSFAQQITHGPVVGGVTPNSARMYVRTTQASPVLIELSDNPNFSNTLLFSDTTIAERDSSVITELSGLDAFTTYYYRITVNGIADTVSGFFKTFPNEGEPGNYIWAVLSCQEYGTYNTFPALQTRNADLIFHTGDWTYPDYQIPGEYELDWAKVQLSYRKKYSELKMPPVLRSSVFDYVVDNHDGIGQRTNIVSVRTVVDTDSVVTNYVDAYPVSEQAFLNMMQGYEEYFPHWNLANDSAGMYHSYRYGNAEIFFVDVRNCGNGQDSTYTYDALRNKWTFNPKQGQTLLGAEQFQWLKNGLRNSTADWKFIVSGVMFNKKFRKILQFAMFFQNLVFGIGSETGSGFRLAHAITANWTGYPREQDGLIYFLDSASIKDVIVLSGHMHTNVMDDGRNAGLPELNTGPVASIGPELTYYIDSIMQSLNLGSAIDSLWNGGGQGVQNKNFMSGFGTIQIYHKDSVVLCIVDEDNVDVSCMKIHHSTSPYASINPLAGQECVIEKIYPNPASDKVYFDFCEKYQPQVSDRVFLMDQSGKMFPTSIENKKFIRIKNLPAGYYMLVYDYGNDVFVDDVIVAR
ncbi:MAG: alkaline phosphatase D family protein [Chitinophagales bacterium]|nr:alkaline phosphatase D family protein [Chitinophagales bacterium]